MVKFGPLAKRNSWASMSGTLDRLLTQLTLVVSEVDVVMSVEVVDFCCYC